MQGPAGWPPGPGGSSPERGDQPRPEWPAGYPTGPGAPPPGHPGPPAPAPPPSNWAGSPAYPGPYGHPVPPPGYPGYPAYPGYGRPPYEAQRRPFPPTGPSPTAGRPWHRRPLLYVAVALIAMVVGVVVFFLATSSPAVTADEQGLVGQCVSVKGNAVQTTDCGKAHDGKVTSVAQHYDGCPSGTLSFRIHPNTGNDHSGCYVTEVSAGR